MADQLIDYHGQLHAFPADFTEKDIAAALAQVDNTETQKSLAKDMAGPPSFSQLASDVASRTPQMLGRVVKNLVMAPIGMAKEAASAAMEGAPGGVGGMLGNVAKRMVIDPAIDQGKKAVQNFQQGRYSEAAGHSAAALLPMLGPAAANIGEKLGTGDPEQMSQGVADAATMAVAPSAMRLTGRVVSGVGNAMKSGGRSAYLRAAKVPESIVKRTTTYQKTGGDLAAGEQEIANTVLSRNAGAITGKNVVKLSGAKKAASDRIGTLANDPNVSLNPTRIKGAMMDELQQMAREADPSVSAAMERAIELESRLGSQITGDQLQPMVVGAGTRNAGKFAQLQQGAGQSRMDMAFRKAARAEQDATIPGLKDANAEFARLKPALQAQAKAKQRVGHHDPIGVTQAAVGTGSAVLGGLLGGPAGAVGLPAVMGLLSFLQRGGPLSRIAQALYNTGGKAQGAGAALSAADMAALVAQLQQQAQPEQ